MATQSVADTRHTTREEIKQAILQRTTRGMLTYNTGRVVHLEGELWAVPSTRGGFHQVHLDREECDCEDFTFYGSAVGVACRHVYAAAIARAQDRGRDHDLRDHDLRDHDHGCYDGWVFLGGEDETGCEVVERVPCRRCRPEAR
jgi:SWIM zinc finger